MLSDEKIEELWVSINKGKFMFAGFNTFARAIEAAVLPEGWVAVPKMPTLAMLDCLRADITSNLEKRYQAMLAAAPKPAQCNCQQGQVCTVCDPDLVPTQAEHYAEKWELVSAALYARPQPDLTAEVERLRQICRDAYEVWAGSNGIPEPITCVEAYLLQLLIAMRDEVKRGLKCPEC